MTSARNTARAAALGGNITQVVDGSAAYEQLFILRDTLTTNPASGPEVVAWVNTGTVAITTAGVATFSSTVTPAAVGDTFVAAGQLFTVTAITTPNTVMTVSPAPAATIAATTFVFNNARSYVDVPALAMKGLRPVPELFRMRYSGTGTLTSTVRWERVNATTGVATAITTDVAFNTAGSAVWQGVAAATTPPGEQTELGLDEFLRLRITTLGTIPSDTTRRIHVELAFSRRCGPNLQ